MTTPAEIVAEARTWKGTRWQHQASLKGVATDCVGMIGGVALALGLPGAAEWLADPRFKGYGRTPDPDVLLAGCDTYLDRIPIALASIGDILVMRFEHDPQHFGIISRVDPIYLVHAYAQARRVVENRLVEVEPTAGSPGLRVVCAYQFRGVGR